MMKLIGMRGWLGILASVALVTMISVSGPSTARANLFVVSPSGDDQTAGTQNAPFQSIGRAAQFAQPGDTVLVRAGVYRERVTPPRSGEPGKPITYRGEKLGQVIVRGSDIWKPE